MVLLSRRPGVAQALIMAPLGRRDDTTQASSWHHSGIVMVLLRH